ncbi:hypothetical protein [Embleya sp. AB8]|uniref:hypothetical protein n=1 Tax=Embleya sp. AB8 TaxID=3156304 RepID=UPI003C72F178
MTRQLMRWMGWLPRRRRRPPARSAVADTTVPAARVGDGPAEARRPAGAAWAYRTPTPEQVMIAFADEAIANVLIPRYLAEAEAQARGSGSAFMIGQTREERLAWERHGRLELLTWWGLRDELAGRVAVTGSQYRHDPDAWERHRRAYREFAALVRWGHRRGFRTN